MGKFDLDVTIRQDAGVHIVALTGPVETATLDGFKARLDHVCEMPAVKVVLDCKGLTYLNSRSIALLMKYHRQVQVSHGRLVLCRLNQKLTRTLELLHIIKSVMVYPSLEEAVASLR